MTSIAHCRPWIPVAAISDINAADASGRRRRCVTSSLLISGILWIAGCGANKAETTRISENSESDASGMEAPSEAEASVPQTSPSGATEPSPVSSLGTYPPASAETPPSPSTSVEEPSAEEPSDETPPTTCNCSLVDGDKKETPEFDNCLEKRDAHWVVAPSAIAAGAFSKKKPRLVLLSRCGAFWALKNGTAQQTQFFDNWADDFVDGRARLIWNGKYGYMDKNLKVTTEPVYEFAWPFAYGYGRVCNQCTFEKMGEHEAVHCKSCGLVDPKGKAVLPLGASPDEIDAVIDAAVERALKEEARAKRRKGTQQ